MSNKQITNVTWCAMDPDGELLSDSCADNMEVAWMRAVECQDFPTDICKLEDHGWKVVRVKLVVLNNAE